MSFIPGTGLLKWVTGSNYAIGDAVSYGTANYVCNTVHTAGNAFDADFASGYWKLINIPVITKNYIGVGSDFENNSGSGWTAAKSALDSTSKLPTDTVAAGTAFASGVAKTGGGTISAATTAQTPAVTGTTPLSGKYSLNFTTSSSGTTAGDMYISSAYTIDICDQAKPLQIKCFYKLVSADSGNVIDMSGTSSNTFALAVYDVTNGAWIQPAGCFNFVQKTGVGIYSGTFQTPSNMTKFQIAVYNPNTVGTYTMSFYLDDFFVGPQPFSQGASMTDWKSYTPTSAWTTNSTHYGRWRRVGDSLEIDTVTTLAGAPNAATDYTITIPSGLTIDTAKLSSTDANKTVGTVSAICAANYYHGNVWYSNGTTLKASNLKSSSSSTHNIFNITALDPATWANGDRVYIRASVPITGWSSNTVQSADTDTRVVGAFVIGLSGGSGSGTVLPFATTKYDTHGGISGLGGSSFKYTCQVSGYYLVEVLLSNTTSANVVALYKNGSVAYGTVNDSTIVPYSVAGGAGSIGIQLNAGDYIDVRNNAANSFSFGNFRVTRISGPAVVQASETFYADFNLTSNFSPTNNSYTQLTGFTKNLDSHSAFSSNAYYIPVSGVWEIVFAVHWYYGSGSASIFAPVVALIYKNGSSLQQQNQAWPASGTTTATIDNFVHYKGKLNAGDYLTFYVFQNTGATLTCQGSRSNGTFFSLTKVGN